MAVDPKKSPESFIPPGAGYVAPPVVTPAPNPSNSGSETTVTATPLLFTGATYIKVKKSKGDKKRYSKGTKNPQQIMLGVSRAGFRVANSFADGLKTFSKRSNRSAKKKKDGMLRDALRNASHGISDELKELGRAPDEIARQIPTRQVRRTFKVLFSPFNFSR